MDDKMSKHSFNSNETCIHETFYELNHALVRLIQKTTNEFTHVIMNNIIAEANNMIKELQIDPNSKKSGATWGRYHYDGRYQWYRHNAKRKNKLVTYPNTDIKFNLVCSIIWHDEYVDYAYDPKTHKSKKIKEVENVNFITFKVFLPNKILKFSTSDMSQLLAEGDILDESVDLDEVEIKQSKPPKKKKKTETDTIESHDDSQQVRGGVRI
jgi:hypothetical protein